MIIHIIRVTTLLLFYSLFITYIYRKFDMTCTFPNKSELFFLYFGMFSSY